MLQLLQTEQPAIQLSSFWLSKLHTLPSSVTTAIGNELDTQGLGHVALGSKPVVHLEGSEEDGIWSEIMAVSDQAKLSKNFMIVAAASNQGSPEDEHMGYLINRSNTLEVITNNRTFSNKNLAWRKSLVMKKCWKNMSYRT